MFVSRPRSRVRASHPMRSAKRSVPSPPKTGSRSSASTAISTPAGSAPMGGRNFSGSCPTRPSVGSTACSSTTPHVSRGTRSRRGATSRCCASGWGSRSSRSRNQWARIPATPPPFSPSRSTRCSTSTTPSRSPSGRGPGCARRKSSRARSASIRAAYGPRLRVATPSADGAWHARRVAPVSPPRSRTTTTAAPRMDTHAPCRRSAKTRQPCSPTRTPGLAVRASELPRGLG